MIIKTVWPVIRHSLMQLAMISGFVLVLALFAIALWNRVALRRLLDTQETTRRETVDLLSDKAAQIDQLQARVAELEQQQASVKPGRTVTVVQMSPTTEAIMVKELRARIVALERWRLQEMGRDEKPAVSHEGAQ